jgi:hypothetical protein
MEADIGHRIENHFAIELENDTQDPMSSRVLWAEVEEHKLCIVASPFKPPFFRSELESILFPILFVIGKAEGAHLGSSGGVFFP